MRIPICSIALMTLGACARAGTPTPQLLTDHTAAIAAISQVATEFSQRYMRGDALGMAQLYTADGVIFPGGRPAIRGRGAIAAYWTPQPGTSVVEHKMTPDSIVIVGNTAYDWGTFRARAVRDGQPGAPGYGKYVVVWQRQPDGEWRMHLDIWNASPAPQP